VARSTIFGRVRVHGVSSIENAILVQPLAVRRLGRRFLESCTALCGAPLGAP